MTTAAVARENPISNALFWALGLGTGAVVVIGGIALLTSKKAEAAPPGPGPGPGPGPAPAPSPNKPPVAPPPQGFKWAPIPQDKNAQYRQWTIPSNSFALIETETGAQTTPDELTMWLNAPQNEFTVYTVWSGGLPVPDGWPGSDTTTVKAYVKSNATVTISGVKVYGIVPVKVA